MVAWRRGRVALASAATRQRREDQWPDDSETFEGEPWTVPHRYRLNFHSLSERASAHQSIFGQRFWRSRSRHRWAGAPPRQTTRKAERAVYRARSRNHVSSIRRLQRRYGKLHPQIRSDPKAPSPCAAFLCALFAGNTSGQRAAVHAFPRRTVHANDQDPNIRRTLRGATIPSLLQTFSHRQCASVRRDRMFESWSCPGRLRVRRDRVAGPTATPAGRPAGSRSAGLSSTTPRRPTKGTSPRNRHAPTARRRTVGTTSLSARSLPSGEPDVFGHVTSPEPPQSRGPESRGSPALRCSLCLSPTSAAIAVDQAVDHKPRSGPSSTLDRRRRRRIVCLRCAHHACERSLWV